jgi:hypothetical protein
MSYETENWARLSPAFRDAHNRLRVARGEQPIPPPAVDLYKPPPARKIVSIDPTDPELLTEYRAATARFDAALRNGDEQFKINGNRVDGLEVVELPKGLGFEGITEGYRGSVHVTEGFTIRR